MQKKQMTAQGVAKLEERLAYLKVVKRHEVADRIEQARAFGDISENAEYDEAKNEQAFMEGEIREIEAALRNVEIIDEKDTSTDIVRLGLMVTVESLDDHETFDLTICGSAEADATQNRISNESPVGQALVGHREGDQVVVQAPGGTFSYKILSIHK